MADELRMNLAAVKRADPYAKDIVETSAHVAFYTFNYEDNEWEKTDVEGAFFVYRRNAEPFHSIFINNRLNTNSLVEPITADLEIQSQPPFLLYRNERSRIRGFWFYNKDELERVADLISGYVKECQKHQRDMEVNTVADTDVRHKSVNIFSMLSKAQEDFDKANLRKDNVGGGGGGVKKQQHPAANATPQSVMNFFAAAAKPAATSTVKEPPLLQRLMSNPAHSVEHIEKQQRAVTPQDTIAGRQQAASPPIGQENGITNVLRRSATSPHAGAESTSSTLAQSWASVLQSANQRTGAAAADKDTDDLYQLLKRTEASTGSKPALMPPTMFSKASPSSTTITPIEPLTQKQLLQAMTYLIKNDPEFLKKLHEAYLKSFSEMVSL